MGLRAQVEVLDAKGNVVSDPNNTDGTDITFAVSGKADAWVEGTHAT